MGGQQAAQCVDLRAECVTGVAQTLDLTSERATGLFNHATGLGHRFLANTFALTFGVSDVGVGLCFCLVDAVQ